MFSVVIICPSVISIYPSTGLVKMAAIMKNVVIIPPDKIITEVQECGENMTARLSIGTKIYCSEIPVLKKIREQYPFIIPEIHEGNISNLMKLLNDRTIEWEKESISLEEISQIPLLLLNAPDSNSLYNRILMEFEKRKLKLNISSVCHDSDLLLKMVLNNFGATIVPKSLANPMLTNFIRIIPIEDVPWKTIPYLIWHNKGYISSTVKKFIKEFDI